MNITSTLAPECTHKVSNAFQPPRCGQDRDCRLSRIQAIWIGEPWSEDHRPHHYLITLTTSSHALPSIFPTSAFAYAERHGRPQAECDFHPRR